MNYVTLKRRHTFWMGNQTCFIATNVKDMVSKLNQSHSTNTPTSICIWNLTLTQMVLALDDASFTSASVNACLQRCWGFIIVIISLTEQKQCWKVWTSTQCLFFITKINVSFPDGPLIDTAVCGESSIRAPQWFKPNCCSFISSVGHLNTLHGLKNLCVDGSKRQKPMLTQQRVELGRFYFNQTFSWFGVFYVGGGWFT